MTWLSRRIITRKGREQQRLTTDDRAPRSRNHRTTQPRWNWRWNPGSNQTEEGKADESRHIELHQARAVGCSCLQRYPAANSIHDRIASVPSRGWEEFRPSCTGWMETLRLSSAAEWIERGGIGFHSPAGSISGCASRRLGGLVVPVVVMVLMPLEARR